MLNISSKRYFKNGETQAFGSTIELEAQTKSKSSKIKYSGKIFEPSTKLQKAFDCNYATTRLVLDNCEKTFVPNSSLGTYSINQVKRESSSTLSITTEDSSDRGSSDVSSPVNSFPKSIHEGYHFQTFKNNGKVASSQLQENKCVNGQYMRANTVHTAAPTYYYTPVTQGSTDSESTLDAQNKKKTRRGGKKARLRREKEKARDTDSPSPSVESEQSAELAKPKYKTELCKNWIEKGKCSYSVR